MFQSTKKKTLTNGKIQMIVSSKQSIPSYLNFQSGLQTNWKQSILATSFDYLGFYLYLCYMENLKWKEIKGRLVRVFQFGDEPQVIYVISNRPNEHMVLYDDAFELSTGKIEFYNTDGFKQKFGIEI